MSRKEFKQKLREIVYKEDIEITNQNIDWLIEKVYKECEQD